MNKGVKSPISSFCCSARAKRRLDALIINLLKVFAYVKIDILNVEIVLLAAIISPLIILGGFLGNALNKRVSQKTFRAVVLALILIIGINLLIKM